MFFKLSYTFHAKALLYMRIKDDRVMSGRSRVIVCVSLIKLLPKFVAKQSFLKPSLSKANK